MLPFSLVCLIRKNLVSAPGFLVFLLPSSLRAQQDRKLEYNIVRHGDLKGTVQLSEHSEGNTRRIKIESLVKTRFLFNISVQTIEEAVYREGLLIYSSFYQKINNDEKHKSQMNWKDGSYQFTGGHPGQLVPRTPIRYSILSLYCQEPVNIREVFSGNFQHYLPVIQVGTGKYRVDLPNGNCNYYIYQHGTLVRVEVDQPFFAVQFILKS